MMLYVIGFALYGVIRNGTSRDNDLNSIRFIEYIRRQDFDGIRFLFSYSPSSYQTNITSKAFFTGRKFAMLASLPLLLSCVSASVIPLFERNDNSLTNVGADTVVSHLTDPFDIRSSKRDTPPYIGSDVVNAISGSIDNTISIPYFNNTQILNEIENSINSQLDALNQGLEALDPLHIFQVVEQSVQNLPSDIDQFKNGLIQNIQGTVGNLFGIHLGKRDGIPSIGSDVINAISGAIERVIPLPSGNRTQILQDIEHGINSQLGDLQQGLEFLDPLHIFQVIENAVKSLPSDIDQFKNGLVQAIQGTVGNLFGIHLGKRDGTPSIGSDVINAISGAIERIIPLPSGNRTQILQDIEHSINSQLGDLQQGLEFLDPLHIFQVIENAVKSLPSDIDQFKNGLVQAIQGTVGNLFGIHLGKRDGTPSIGSDVINAISGAIERIIPLPSGNRTQILQDIEHSINSQLGDLQQGLEFLDPLHIFQVIENAVKSLPSDIDQFKNGLVQAIQGTVGNLFGIHLGKRDGIFSIGSDVVNAISGAIERVIPLPSGNRTQILQDIEHGINSQLGDLQQGLEFLDPLHIFQVIENAVKSLPSDIDQFKNGLVQAIQGTVGNLFGIHPSKK
ncbi:ZYRO0G06028p [Zygosaccharomyces rouxii]|uniref:ZYRO0G06028p n=1 Tax=Zygosaccharomyces rouxii (strain ATCC 2623 / CBS 732 / NBRC 1130 / NCYC 568 / NRRL Y-229) TaxID=559307 RepID=C5DZP2_ZYGRC|nr:uncharacterized protein ZYRO0G06028g [Zygosaccharomyces rouxii]KAH9202323.1 hypothetical protein LQ764DRAFT_211953 [Zygosaccharomyces rouxii]CAR29326.1 ZYRO0G06028p [Zygosaccharomyces rouxii]